MKIPFHRLTLVMLCISIFLTNAYSNFGVYVTQEIQDGQCYGEISVAIAGDAGPFDIYLYSNANQAVLLQEFLEVDEGLYEFTPVEAWSDWVCCDSYLPLVDFELFQKIHDRLFYINRSAIGGGKMNVLNFVSYQRRKDD